MSRTPNMPDKYCYRESDKQVWVWTPKIEKKEGMRVITRDEFLLMQQSGELPTPPPPKELTGAALRAKPDHDGLGAPRRNPVDPGSIKEGIWKGRRAFVVASGPSLMDFDFSRLEGELVVCVNRSGEYAPASITYTLDAPFNQSIVKGSLADPQRALDFYLSPTYRLMALTKDATPDIIAQQDMCLKKIEPHHVMAETFAEGIGHGKNSGFGALNLAILLGADPIYLLGFDMGFQSQSEAHFHPEYAWADGKKANAELVAYKELRIPCFEQAAPWIKRHAKVINLNPESALKCFPFGDIDSIPQKPERPLVVCYYTEGTPYKDEARAMQATAQLFGLRCDVQPRPSFGTWQDNTRYKATFIREMLEKHNRPICWLDADARVRKYPVAFDEFCSGDYDFGYNMIEWDKLKSSRRTRHELNSACMLFRPTKAAFTLLDEWITLNEARRSRDTLEQQNLQDLLDKRGMKDLKPFPIPMNHCQVDTWMAELGDPVIEQLQASRKYRKVVFE